ncbi:MAG: tetratricopeptide repeat protein [Candidatus Falkowbacteria bacterium]
MDKLSKLFKIIILVGLTFLVALIFFQKIDFTGIDLGRHLENGRVVWQNPQVLFQNFYSYTGPNTSFVNHHWLSGVILYLVYLLDGFKGLIIFNCLLAVSVFLLAFNLAYKKAGFYLSATVSLPIIYLLSERVEIRPEIFSYLFILLVWFLIDKTAKDQKWRRLFWLIPLFTFWVNLHIYFFIGLTLVGLKMAAEFLRKFIYSAGNFQERFGAAWLKAKPWTTFLGWSILSCLVNPNTWRGLLYPFNIFENYGYEIAENKSVFYLGHLMISPNFLLFKIILLVLIVSWLIYIFVSRKIRFFDLFLSFLFSGLALFASRNLALFALAALVLIPANLSCLKFSWKFFNRTKNYFVIAFISLVVGSSVYLIIDSRSYHNFIKNPLGFTLSGGGDASANFFKTNNLSGPIFNNYDIGSALIFWLFPQEKVFVDNRPEAYSNKFFKETYIPMQNETGKWEAVSNDYKFKTIYFSHTDGTPWAQQFLGRILNDDNWSLVYFDQSTVILLNKKLTDKTLLKKLSLTEKDFRDRLRLLSSHSGLKDKMSLASLADRANQPLLAEEIYHGILMDYPDYSPVLVSLGALYSNTDLIKSLSYFDLALAGGHRLPGVYNQIGLVNWQLGEYQKAETAWNSALKLDHHNTSALYYLNQIKELRKSGKLSTN